MNKHGTGHLEDYEVPIDALGTVQAKVVKLNLLVDGGQSGLMTLCKGLIEGVHKLLLLHTPCRIRDHLRVGVVNHPVVGDPHMAKKRLPVHHHDSILAKQMVRGAVVDKSRDKEA